MTIFMRRHYPFNYTDHGFSLTCHHAFNYKKWTYIYTVVPYTYTVYLYKYFFPYTISLISPYSFLLLFVPLITIFLICRAPPPPSILILKKSVVYKGTIWCWKLRVFIGIHFQTQIVDNFASFYVYTTRTCNFIHSSVHVKFS